MVNPSGAIVVTSLLATCRPATGLPIVNGRGSILWLDADVFKQGALPRICTGCPLLLVNDSNCGRLASESASAPKSSSEVEGTTALAPIPMMGTAKEVLLSALVGLL